MLRSALARRSSYWGKQGAELLNHRLALYSRTQRMIFGANTCKQFAQMLAFSTKDSDPRLHFVGSSLSLVCLTMLIATGKPRNLLYGLPCGYGFAWVGHFGFEKNRPASF